MTLYEPATTRRMLATKLTINSKINLFYGNGQWYICNNDLFRSPSSGYPRPGGGGAAGPAMWQWQNNNGSADPALTPTTTEGVDMLSMLGRTHTHVSRD
jgi:hypothetical protein